MIFRQPIAGGERREQPIHVARQVRAKRPRARRRQQHGVGRLIGQEEREVRRELVIGERNAGRGRGHRGIAELPAPEHLRRAQQRADRVAGGFLDGEGDLVPVDRLRRAQLGVERREPGLLVGRELSPVGSRRQLVEVRGRARVGGGGTRGDEREIVEDVTRDVVRDLIELGEAGARDVGFSQRGQRRKPSVRIGAVVRRADESTADERRGLGVVEQIADRVQRFVHRQPQDALAGDDQPRIGRRPRKRPARRRCRSP